jgi:membrane dipeptidase
MSGITPDLPDMSSPEPTVPFASLHERLFTIDTHCDTPTAGFERAGWDFAQRHDYATDHSQIDLPRLREGGMDAMVFAVYVMQAARTPEGHSIVQDLAVRCFERTHAILRANAGACEVALSVDDALRLKREGKRAIFLSVENAYSLGRDPANVSKFHRLGVRMMGLTHMLNNDVADSSTDPRGAEWGGLSPLGREIVGECNRLGIVLDASHASDAVLRDLLAHSRAPVMLSHSGCRAVADHPRNVGDDLLRELAARDGVIQINALPIALVNAPDSARTAATSELLLRYKDAVLTPDVLAASERDYETTMHAHPNPRVTVEDVIRHIEHAVKIAGIDHVGIGFDLDGGGGGFEGLRDVADYPNITRLLLARGRSERDLEKLWGGNTVRVMRAVRDFV